ncbi:MAG TPA: hypothetical protein VK870_01005 [Ignavibacteriaceae bacterium]|nr:hypothetical protein [Ignavibacteriaceae bacterium]
MELIPILSTIILVATISTFLLSIGAYILYKIRERKSVNTVSSRPKTVQAELIVPADVLPGRSSTLQQSKSPQYQSPFTVQKPAQQSTVNKPEPEFSEPASFSVEDTKKVFAPRHHYAKKTRDTKFFKYTSEGYIPTEDDKATGVLKWR